MLVSVYGYRVCIIAVACRGVLQVAACHAKRQAFAVGPQPIKQRTVVASSLRAMFGLNVCGKGTVKFVLSLNVER